MKWPVSLRFGSDMRHRTPHAPREVSRSSGYTLIEILVATTLALMLLGAVVRMFAQVGEGITDSRAMLEAADRLRVVQTRLQQDLGGVTVTMNPPAKPENNEGYFEYIEGPVGTAGAMTQPSAVAFDTTSSSTATPDTTVGDFDDILMFTTRSTGRPFVGKYGATTIQSDVAEVAWFLRGRTLYRRVLLVAPSATVPVYTSYPNNYYANFDVSARVGKDSSNNNIYVFNTLGDLTRRECRFAHGDATFPFDVRNWSWTHSSLKSPTLPTLKECSYSSGGYWTVNNVPSTTGSLAASTLDFWSNASGNRIADNSLIGGGTNLGTRVADDVILTNVIGFDVKAWDPTQGSYVDLGYADSGYDATLSGNGNGFAHRGVPKSQLEASATTPKTARVYDTWSTHYEATGIGVPADAGRALNGFDDNNNGIVDDEDEKVTCPPYPIPLRGIQVKIRIFEPDSKQIREVTVVQEFLPQ